MSPTTSAVRRRRHLTGVLLATGLALGSAVVANGASREAGGAGPVGSTSASRVAGPSATDCAAMGAVVAAAATASSTGTAGTVDAARGRALGVARSTASDDVREVAQNLADDLAAYRVAVTTASSESHRRRTDIGLMIHGDLVAARLLCGR